MQRAGGDLATPDCPECCGQSSCASATLCTTTPGYAGIHPKKIRWACPEDRRICHHPDTARLVEYNGYCYQPAYDQDGLLVCETCPTSTQDDFFIADPSTIVCLAPGVTCATSPCNQAMGTPLGCAARADMCTCRGAESGICAEDCPACCAKRWLYVWSATTTTRSYTGGTLCNEYKQFGSGATICTYTSAGDCPVNPPKQLRVFGGTFWTSDSFCPPGHAEGFSADTTGAQNCGWIQAAPGSYLPYDPESPGVKCEDHGTFNGGQEYRDYNVDLACDSAHWYGEQKRYTTGLQLIEHTMYEFTAALYDLDPCASGAMGGGEPPSLAELGLF